MIFVLFALTAVFCGQIGVEVARRHGEEPFATAALLLFFQGALLMLIWLIVILVAVTS